MNCRFGIILVLLPIIALSACQTSSVVALPRGGAAYETIPAPVLDEPRIYRIGPLDVLNVAVFREPELSVREAQVDGSGDLELPLVGSIHVAGLTPAELAAVMARKLNSGYVRDPRVSVTINSTASLSVAVEGSVTEPGVYEIKPNATLLEVLARAKSPTRVAKLDQIVVFRVIGSQRVGAVFDLRRIRAGGAPDPQILGGDTIVVGFSAVKGAFRDFLTAAPILNLFRPF